MSEEDRASRRPRLIEHQPGQQPYMRCPRCRTRLSILAFPAFGEIKDFIEETAPIYKCPRKLGGCGWIFALANEVPPEFRNTTKSHRGRRHSNEDKKIERHHVE